MKCRNCNKPLNNKILSIPAQPISSVFLKKKIKNLIEYPLDLYECNFCKLIQFKKLAPLGDMYGSTYGYRTSLSKLMVDHIKTKFEIIKKNNFVKNNDKILDIGCNDGTFLNLFAKLNLKKLSLYGVDPSAEKFKKYYNSKIQLIIDFFSVKLANNLIKSKLKNKFKLITSFAMFYDIEDPNGFCKSIDLLLHDNGKWISEFSYFPLLLQNLTYDQICHEHVTYYTLSTFKKIIEQNNLIIQDISFNEINGGSIEVSCIKKSSRIKVNHKKIKKVLESEKTINKNSYEELQKRINNVKYILNLLLKNINRNDIIGYGASTKGNIVLNHCEISNKQIKYICDSNEEKHGKFTPGSNIEIISKEKMRKIKPKYLLVLIWSFRKEVIKQELEYIKNGGTLILHLPVLHIVNKENYKQFIKDDFKAFSYNTN